MLAIIGGSGLGALANLAVSRRERMDTPFGEPSDLMTLGAIAGRNVLFLARHGSGHTLAPHQINYRANMWALHAREARDVVALASVGGIRADLAPGALVVPHQILDYTSGRDSTFSGVEGRKVLHVDFTEPYTERLRQRILAAAKRAGHPVVDGAVYAATQGPRLETAAEIDRLERDGASIVGMTGMPEAALARELGLGYATLAVVVNHAAGRGTSAGGVRMEDIDHASRAAMGKVLAIIERLVENDGG